MKKTYTFLQIFTTLLLIASCASEKEPAQGNALKADADTLYLLARNIGLPEPLPRVIGEQFSNMRTVLDDTSLETAQILIGRYYSFKGVHNRAKDVFTTQFQPRYASLALRELHKPMFRELHYALNGSLNEDDKKRVIEYANMIARDSSLQKRVQWLKEMNGDSVKALQVEAYKEATLTLLKLQRLLSDKESDIHRKNLKFVAEAEARAYEKRLQQEIIFERLYKLRNLSDEKLKQIHSFYTSPAGRWYSRSVQYAQTRAIAGASAALRRFAGINEKEN